MHAETSGLADYLAEDEMDAIRIGREVVSHLNWRKRGYKPSLKIENPINYPEDLLGLVDPDLKKAFDIREVITRITDGSRFEEFKSLFGVSSVLFFLNFAAFFRIATLSSFSIFELLSVILQFIALLHSLLNTLIFRASALISFDKNLIEILIDSSELL